MFKLDYDLDTLIQRLEAVKNEIPALMEQGVQQLGELAVISLQDHCPVDDEPNNGVISGEEGHLAESFVAGDTIVSGARVQQEIITTEPVKFSFMTEGTTQYEPIFPTQKQALWWPGAEHPVAYVMGQEANPFQNEAQAEIEGFVEDVAREVVAKIVEKLKGA